MRTHQGTCTEFIEDNLKRPKKNDTMRQKYYYKRETHIGALTQYWVRRLYYIL